MKTKGREMQKSRKHTGTLRAKRIQAVLKAMRRGGFWSPMRLIKACGVTNPGECVSAMRMNGVAVEKRSVPGARHCEWRLVRSEKPVRRMAA